MLDLTINRMPPARPNDWDGVRRFTLMFADATSIQEDDPEPADDAAIRMIVASRFCIPPTAIDVQGCDGSWVDFTVGFAFEAGSLAEVRVEAERIMRMCGRDVEVFSVTDESDSVVLTEDDL